ncbi:uncharacterized protein B0H18DRAFT_1108170 [Fomitopsis serialis]|uniref:uncharacterized protein n=1 Tax=Fomitopsis serialis TaxID=139415 RepID=UPI002008121F|nr:uncharacterized protein B0H18DRAFT_1108170 [Neoantrodia serialis]KAH9914982.1 hypothetical protein B0H18DRAFT_1108170 [Neoantrodia serialis]
MSEPPDSDARRTRRAVEAGQHDGRFKAAHGPRTAVQRADDLCTTDGAQPCELDTSEIVADVQGSRIGLGTDLAAPRGCMRTFRPVGGREVRRLSTLVRWFNATTPILPCPPNIAVAGGIARRVPDFTSVWCQRQPTKQWDQRPLSLGIIWDQTVVWQQISSARACPFVISLANF